MADNTTKAPNKIVITAVKFTSNASEPYFANPPFSKNVSFSRNPRAAVPIANTYTNSPKNTCQGSESRLMADVPPGKKNTTNPNIHCRQSWKITELIIGFSIRLIKGFIWTSGFSIKNLHHRVYNEWENLHTVPWVPFVLFSNHHITRALIILYGDCITTSRIPMWLYISFLLKLKPKLS